MELNEFRIQNYRSVVDSDFIKVADITAFIGSNESGKSSLLEGLSTISMDSEYNYFNLTQLDSILKKFNDLDLLPQDIPIVWAKFDITDDEEKKLQTFTRQKDIKISTFEVIKYFNETYKILINENEFNIPSTFYLNAAFNKINSLINSLKKQSDEHLKRAPNNQHQQEFNRIISELKKITEKVDSVSNVKKHIQSLNKFITLEIDQPFKKDIKKALNTINEMIEDNFPKSKTEVSLYKFLISNMPRTVYFKTYERLEDNVSIKELRNNPNAHKTFLNLLKLAELKLDTIERLDDDTRRQVYIESGCGKATNLLREAWKQEELEIEIRYSDGRLMVFTKNSKAVETLLPPSLGSEGFQWFLGFYIHFGAATNAEYRRAILLLDDPGVFLHPKGHKDLLNLYEGYLKRDVTTLYSTHLPFLIPRNNLKRLRLVQKDSSARTVVTEKFYSVEDKDILYPLRAALGITLADSLFIGDKTIVAEGLSDRIIIYNMLEEFNTREIKNIDLEKIEILAGAGAKGVKNYAIMLQIEDLPFVVVLDNDNEGRDSRHDFVKDGIPETKIIILPQSVNDKQKDFDIEDLFSINIYAEAFVEVHGKHINMNKEQAIEKFMKGNDKINNKAIKILKKKKYKLDKVSVAYELVRIIKNMKKIDKKSLQNFNALFNSIHEELEIYQ